MMMIITTKYIIWSLTPLLHSDLVPVLIWQGGAFWMHSDFRLFDIFLIDFMMKHYYLIPSHHIMSCHINIQFNSNPIRWIPIKSDLNQIVYPLFVFSSLSVFCFFFFFCSALSVSFCAWCWMIDWGRFILCFVYKPLSLTPWVCFRCNPSIDPVAGAHCNGIWILYIVALF